MYLMEEIYQIKVNQNLLDLIIQDQEDEFKKEYLKDVQNITYIKSKYDVLKDSDALVLLTEWEEFRSPDFVEIKAKLKNPILFDARNQCIEFDLNNNGFEY